MDNKEPRPAARSGANRAAGQPEELFRGASNPPDINNHDYEQARIEARKPGAARPSRLPPATSHATLKQIEPAEAASSIARPTTTFDLEKFKSKRPAAVASLETLPTALPYHNIAAAKDFVRLHPDETKYWSPELCFVNVPIKGQKSGLHLIDEELAMRCLPSARILRFRLALASKPYDALFLCHVPTRNLDNSWNKSNLQACEQAKRCWTQATSRKEEGVDAYKIDVARDPDAFPEPNWPSQLLVDLIGKTFAGCTIDREDHPGLSRLIGAKQSTS
jgi:hypothetical protein